MTWQGIRGHDDVVERFKKTLAAGRLASTFLFVGPEGVGKRKFAFALAKAFLCERVDERELSPCGQCPACRQVDAGSHPDVTTIAKPEDRAFIPLALLIGEREHRNKTGLAYEISGKPSSGKRRVGIIDDADQLNEEGANALLKTLEEPPPKAVLILIGTSPQRQLPTIRSRSQIVRFNPLNDADVAAILLDEKLVETPEEATAAAARSQGSVRMALEMSQPRTIEHRRDFLQRLATLDIETIPLAKAVMEFVGEGTTEGAVKRARVRRTIDFAMTYYRGVMLRGVGASDAGEAEVKAIIERTLRWWPGGPEAAGHGLDRCLDAARALDGNANLSTLVDAWLDDLATIHRTGFPRT